MKSKSGLISGTILITLGLAFLLDNLGVVDVSVIWPIIPLGIGFSLLIKHFRQ